jgi:uncharacterized protein YcnI
MMRRRIAFVLAATALLAFPAGARAHVSLHPNVVPAGANATVDLRVPNEQESAKTTKVAVQFPPGFLDVVTGYIPGWSAEVKTEKLATPVKTDEGTVDSQVTEVTWTADSTADGLPPERFLNFPFLTAFPDQAGQVLTFKTVQTYSNGDVSRWIGTPDSESPAPTLDVTTAGGALQDVAGSETGPPLPSKLAAATGGATVTASKTTVVKQSSGASKGLGIAALIAGLVGILLGAVALGRSRRRGGATGA